MVTDPLEVLRDRGVLSWEPMRDADRDEVASLAAAIESLDDVLERHSIGEILETLAHSHVDLAQVAVVGRDQHGSIVAYGLDLVHPQDTSPRRVTIVGGVHPAWRDKGIGHGLLDWQLAAATRWDHATRRSHHGPLKVQAVADSKLMGIRELYESYGLQPEVWYLDAHRTFRPDAPPRHPEVSEPVRLRRYPDADPMAVLAAHNEAFRERPGASQVGPAEWHESMTRPDSRPDLSWVLAVGERVIGYALNCVESDSSDEAQEGWTDRLGVIPAWRGRGFSRTLLEASAASFYEAGLPGAGIGVDTDDPMAEMARYRGLGYDSVDALVGYARVLH